MARITDESELDAYYLSSSTNERAAGVMWPAIIERRIDKLFSLGLRQDKTVHNELFQPSGALGNYAVKVRLAYLLKWIEKDLYDDLLIVARIRNRFAHVIEARDFTDEKILAWLKNMKAHKLIAPAKKFAEKRAEEDPSLEKTLAVDALAVASENPQMGFRFCLDMMLHQMDRCGEAMTAQSSAPPASSDKS